MPNPSKELAVLDVTPSPADFSVTRSPAVVLEEAHNAARALKDVIDKRKRKIILGGQQYLTFEDWSTLGRFYGVTARIVNTRAVEFEGVHGFAATAVALRADGVELSAAEAMCLTDEPSWAKRPAFQRLSMAQTRAAAKVLRMVLAWVVVLAGYAPTPVEELTHVAREPGDEGPDDGPDDPEDVPPPPSPRRAAKPSPGLSPLRSSVSGVMDADPIPAAGQPATRPTPARPFVPVAAAGSIGTIVEVRDVKANDGTEGALIRLSTGFMAGTKDAEIIVAAKHTPPKFRVELVTRPPSGPGRAPTVIELRQVGREVEP